MRVYVEDCVLVLRSWFSLLTAMKSNNFWKITFFPDEFQGVKDSLIDLFVFF